MGVMLYPFILCVALLIDMFILCVACLTVFMNCLVKQLARFFVWFVVECYGCVECGWR